MKLTRDQKGKVALGILGTAAVYMVYNAFFSGPPAPPSDAVGRAGPAAGSSIPTAPRTARRPTRKTGNDGEWHPVWQDKNPENRPNPLEIDPTLMTDKLAKVMAVDPAGGSRNLFAFGQPPPKPTELPKGPEPKLHIMGPMPAPAPAPAVAAVKTDPPPAPINVKFYGFSTAHRSGQKKAYFLDGDDILIGSEGDTLKKHYKLIRINNNSALFEDTESKKQQSVPLTPEATSS